MMKRIIGFGVIAMMALTGCSSRDAGKNEGVLAEFGKEKIMAQDFTNRINALSEGYRKIAQTKKQDFLEDIILEELLYQEALRKGVDKEKQVQNLIQESKRKIIIARLVERETASITALPDEMKKYYEENKEKFKVPEKVKVSHILVNTQAEADALLQKLQAGTSFEQLAKESSIDPTKDQGGDIGYVSAGDLIPDFEKAAFALQKDQVSGVVKTNLGYHIIKVTDRIPEKILPYEEVEKNISAELANQQKRDHIMQYADQLKKKANIKINQELLGKIQFAGVAPVAEEKKEQQEQVQTEKQANEKQEAR